MTTPAPALVENPERAAAAAVRWFPASLIVLALASSAITWGTPYFQLILSWSLLALLVALTLTAARAAHGRLPAGVSAAGFASVVLAVEAGILLLLVPVTILVLHNPADDIPGWTYPYLNKRWFIALYGVLIVTFLLLPVVFRRAFPRLEAPETPALHEASSAWWSKSLGLVIVAALAWFAAGPPWNVERHHRAIDFHEQVHLGPLQAIAKGHMPFIGPASTQYGPGSQLLTYAYMSGTGRFTIVGYRQMNLLIHFTSLLAAGLLALWIVDLPTALLVMVLALAFSPVSFFVAAPDGTFQGAYGWGNAFRYLGALLVVPAAALTAGRAGPRWISWTHVGLGLLWGFFAWVSQENLTATGAAGGMVLLLMVATRTIELKKAIAVAISLAVGFLVFWIPLLAAYAAYGQAGAFLGNYFRVAQAVAMGFSNSWWSDATNTPVYTAFRLTPAVIIVVGLATLWKFPALELRSPLDRRQVRLLAFVAILAASYATSLYRSDASHLINTLIALPFVLALAFRDLPAWAAASWAGRLAIRAAVVAGALYVYPLQPLLSDMYSGLIKPSLVRFQPLPPLPPVPADDRVAFRRATAYLSDEPLVVAGSVPMRQFLEELSVVRDLIGDRETFLTGMGSVYTGLVYFLGDLTPADYLLERETMTINSLLSQEVLHDYRRRAREVECVMVREMEMDEAKIFLEAHPGARVEQRPLGGRPVFVLLAPVTP